MFLKHWLTLPHLEKSKINLDLTEDASFLVMTPWTLSPSTVHFDLAQFKKEDMTTPETTVLPADCFLLSFTERKKQQQKNIADGLKTDEGVAAAAVSTKDIRKLYTCHFPDDSCVYTGELRAIVLALRHIYHSQEKSFLILSDFLTYPT